MLEYQHEQISPMRAAISTVALLGSLLSERDCSDAIIT
jgi:hypothetical protein